MDPTYIYNQRQNRAGFQFLNAVGDDGYNYDNSYFGAAVIDFQKETDSGTRWRLTLAPNRGVGAVFDGQSIVHEASVSVPLTDLQTRLIAGQIPDWSGYEYLQPTLNKLITHNLLFDFTLPTAYTGAGLELTSGKWLVKGMLANMNAQQERRRRERRRCWPTASTTRAASSRASALPACTARRPTSARRHDVDRHRRQPGHRSKPYRLRRHSRSTCSRSTATSSAATGRCRAS